MRLLSAPPADSIPVAALSAGTLDTDVIVPYAQSLNDQVTSTDNGTAQLFSTVDGRGIALGYKDSGGTYHQVLTINTDGTITATVSGNVAKTGDTMTGALTVPQLDFTSGGNEQFYATSNAQQHWTPQSGAANWHEFVGWNGSAATIPFGVGSAAAGLSKSYVDDNGNLTAASLAGAWTPPNGGGLHGVNKISGSGSATVNHGLSVTPDAAVVNTNNGSNSTTFGSGSYTATTVYIYQFNAQPWVGLAYKA